MREEMVVAAEGIDPVIAALEKADVPVVAIDGYLGTSDGKAVRLYTDLDTSAYVEIPRDAIVYLEADGDGHRRLTRAFVRASSEVLDVRRLRVPAADWSKRLPPLETFWTCAAACEGDYTATMAGIERDAMRALHGPNPEARLAEIDTRRTEAQRTLLTCLTLCADRRGTPRFMSVPDPSAPGGVRVEPFSLAGYHQIVMARVGEKLRT